MLTKAEIKQISDLQRSRERQRLGLFVCEGHKLVGDMLGAYSCVLLIATEEAYTQLQAKLRSLPREMSPERIEIVDKAWDFKRISSLTTPQPVLAVYKQRADIPIEAPEEGLCLYLDDVQDPGNVGTIIRTADWFGVKHIYLSSGSADPYSPKVLQATMGAMSRVVVRRLGKEDRLLEMYQGEILGAFLGGEDLYTLPKCSAQAPRLLVLGNEGNGISPEVAGFVTRRITIPPYDASSTGSESLNVAIAGAVCLSQLRQLERQ